VCLFLGQRFLTFFFLVKETLCLSIIYTPLVFLVVWVKEALRVLFPPTSIELSKSVIMSFFFVTPPSMVFATKFSKQIETDFGPPFFVEL